jgi:hypothetical protein
MHDFDDLSGRTVQRMKRQFFIIYVPSQQLQG